MKQSSFETNITVIGTGLAGMVQALALVRRDIPCTLIGPRSPAKKDSRTTAILSPGIQFLQNLDLWPDLASSATALVTMELVDGNHHHVFDAHEIGQSEFGYNISNAALTALLQRELTKSKRVTWHAAKAEHIEKSSAGWGIRLDSGDHITTELLIGADGRNSPTRKASGITLSQQTFDQAALVTVLQSEKPHFNTTLEWFRQGGPFTLVPVERNKFALVWCDTDTELQKARMMPLPELEILLGEMTTGRFGALKVIDSLHIWPVSPMLATRMIGDHCALVGEAAHVLPPIGAQGFNISLHDIIALTDILAENGHLGLAPSHGVQLKRYERIRLRDIALRYHAMNTLNSTLHTTNPALHGLRRLSLRGVQRMTLLKRHLMTLGLRHAA